MKPQRWTLLLLVALLSLALAACDDNDSTTLDDLNNAANNSDPNNSTPNNAEPNNSTPNNAEPNNSDPNNADPNNSGQEFTGAYKDVKATEVTENLDLEGLDHPVHVSRDEWGIPHIIGESVEDVIQVQGYIHAQDRYAQMELFRRSTNGTLAQLAGGLAPSTISDDIFQRVIGFRRTAQDIYDTLEPDGLTLRTLEAYSRGVNAYIAKLRAREESVPLAAASFVIPSLIEDWTPLDCLVLVRFQQYNLSFDAFTEIRLSQAREGVAEAFPADSEDPQIAARAGILTDMIRWAPADATYQTPGFTQAQNKKAGGARKDGHASWKAPNKALLDRSARAFEKPFSKLMERVKIPQGMSNSWVLSGDKTASGNAMLANDPHLSLDSPALFHQVHLVVEPATEADGPALNVFGAIFPGLPGVLIGHNEKVAWGLTTASYDYTDVYLEELVWEDGEEWPRVMHNGEAVELEIIEEEIISSTFGSNPETITVKIPIVPHHGPLAPVIDGRELKRPEGDQALSIAWTGHGVSNEIKALMGFMTAGSIDDVKVALDDWVIGTQNLVFVDASGNIFKTGESYIPQRPEAARTWDPETNPDGTAPWWVLSGTGEHDWEGGIDRATVPQVTNPAIGYVTTANNDQAGVTDDNNPLNDSTYLGYDYDLGFRAGRIERMLTGQSGPFPENHKYSLEDLGTIQTDTYSNLGERLAPVYVALLERALEEYATPGTHADLQGVVEANPDGQGRVERMRDLLRGWSYEADNGLTGDVTPERIQDSAATALFNLWTGQLQNLTFGDERAAAPTLRPSSQQVVKALIFIIENPEASATFREETGQSALWDDLRTEDVDESRGQIMLTSFFAADAQLGDIFGSPNPEDWLWGQEHARTFTSIIPSLGGATSRLSLPGADDEYPDGFPRSGDNYNVDACNGGFSGNLNCGGGAIMRFLVEMDPAGVRSFNAQPGGQIWDPDSPHFRDTLDVWLEDDRYMLRFLPEDVAAKVDQHILFE